MAAAEMGIPQEAFGPGLLPGMPPPDHRDQYARPQESLLVPLHERRELVISGTENLAYIKDPSRRGNVMFFTGNMGRDDRVGWGQYVAGFDAASNAWINLGQVRVNGVEGSSVCAMGARQMEDGSFSGVIQDRVIEPGGVIHEIVSADGITFNESRVLIRSSEPGSNVYDPEWLQGLGPTGGVIGPEGKERHFITATHIGGYDYTPATWGIKSRAIDGTIDLYEVPASGEAIKVANLFTEYTVSGHTPTLEGGEWPPEGTSITQVDHDLFIAGVVHFPKGQEGNTQRLGLFVSRSLEGPYTSIGVISPEGGHGETGHPSLIVVKDPTDSTNDRVIVTNQKKPVGGDWRIEESYILADDLRRIARPGVKLDTLPVAA